MPQMNGSPHKDSEVGGHDETEEYDRQHGVTTDADAAKPSGLTEASNKPPTASVPFTITTSK